jgi:hypothetical protein
VVRFAVFNNPRSPYLQLFRAAGCELGDVEALVAREGVEGALQALVADGIYVLFDEFKGRKPAVRGSQTFAFRDKDFDNPLITPHYEVRSGGTWGRPTRIVIDLEYLADRAPLWSIWFAAHDLIGAPLVFLTPYYPGVVNLQLICAKFGTRFDKWFATASGGSTAYQLVSALVHGAARHAAGFPRPEFVTARDSARVGEYLAHMARAGRTPCVNCSASDAIRVCLAMTERGVSLNGVRFLLGYEPVTRARRQAIEATGARVAMTYGFSEGGTVGQQCPRPEAPDDVHVATDAFAVIQRARPVDDESRRALLMTALRPMSPKVMLNAEIGDQAVMEHRACGCVFGGLGYDQHLHTIRSFAKLTGTGVTFLGADIFPILEEALPRKFGGAIGDYQLIEEESANGLPRYSLLVNPGVGPVNERALIGVFLEELGAAKLQYRFMANQWIDAGVLGVSRRPAIPTARGKIVPFRTLVSR